MSDGLFEGFVSGAEKSSSYALPQPLPSPGFKDESGPAVMLATFPIGPQSGSAVAPSTVLETFDAGVQQQDFLYDFYFRIWVFPKRIELRNPRKGVDIPFAIWNAFPYKNDLSSITTIGAEGLVLDIEAPSQFREIEYRTVNLQITPAAPLTIEALFSFVFDEGRASFSFNANLASVLSIVPDMPINESWQWLTNVMTSVDGSEQRIGLRGVPRRKLDTKFIVVKEREVIENIKKALFDFGGQVVIPYFQYSTTTTEEALQGAVEIKFNLSRTDVRENEYVFIVGKSGEELAKITTIGEDGAILDAPTTVDFPKGSLVVPAFASVVENKSSIARFAVNEAAEISINSVSSQARNSFKRPSSNASISTFNGYAILDKRPLANSNVEDRYDQGYERFDYETGSIEQISRWHFVRIEGPRQYLVHRITQPETLDFWRDFLDISRGMLNPFLVPTFRQDLFPATRPDAGYVTLEISGADYGSLLWEIETFKRIVISTEAGEVYNRVTNVELLENGNTVCTLLNPMPIDEGYRNIKSISYLMKVRLASDEVALEHYGLETILNLSIRTVQE